MPYECKGIVYFVGALKRVTKPNFKPKKVFNVKVGLGPIF